jgi:hypothetical protein
MPYNAVAPTMLSVMDPVAVPPIVLLFTTTFWPVVPATRIPRKPTIVPVPPEAIVMDPTLLFEMLVAAKLKSKIAMAGAVLAVMEVALTTIVDEPSRLPTVFPVVVPMLNNPAVAPTEIPMKPASDVVVELRAVVWAIPEIVLFWMLVATLVLVLGASIPLNSFVEPVMVVVPVPSEAPNPITFPVTVIEPFAPGLSVMPA